MVSGRDSVSVGAEQSAKRFKGHEKNYTLWHHHRREHNVMYLCEFVGTFVLNLSIGMNTGKLFDAFHPISVSATIAIVVGYGADISGAHYNPALTAGFYFAGDRKAPPPIGPIVYVLIIIVAAIAANFLAYGISGGGTGLPAFAGDTKEWAKACAAEFVGTYLAIFNVLMVAMVTRMPLGNMGPILVALGFYANIVSFAHVSGAVLNPGLAFGLWTVGMADGKQTDKYGLALYLVFEMLGGICAGLTARLALRYRENEDRGSKRVGADDVAVPDDQNSSKLDVAP
jgi:aquaporin Z